VTNPARTTTLTSSPFTIGTASAGAKGAKGGKGTKPLLKPKCKKGQKLVKQGKATKCVSAKPKPKPKVKKKK
jgi:hypothetical protein